MTILDIISWLEKQAAPNAHLCLDTRHIQTGDVFFACAGLASDGHAYIDQAIAKGASAIVVDQDAADKSTEIGRAHV